MRRRFRERRRSSRQRFPCRTRRFVSRRLRVRRRRLRVRRAVVFAVLVRASSLSRDVGQAREHPHPAVPGERLRRDSNHPVGHQSRRVGQVRRAAVRQPRMEERDGTRASDDLFDDAESIGTFAAPLASCGRERKTTARGCLRDGSNHPRVEFLVAHAVRLAGRDLARHPTMAPADERGAAAAGCPVGEQHERHRALTRMPGEFSSPIRVEPGADVHVPTLSAHASTVHGLPSRRRGVERGRVGTGDGRGDPRVRFDAGSGFDAGFARRSLASRGEELRRALSRLSLRAHASGLHAVCDLSPRRSELVVQGHERGVLLRGPRGRVPLAALFRGAAGAEPLGVSSHERPLMARRR